MSTWDSTDPWETSEFVLQDGGIWDYREAAIEDMEQYQQDWANRTLDTSPIDTDADV